MDEDRFKEIEREVKVLLLEASGYIDDEKIKKAEACLKEVDEKVSLIAHRQYLGQKQTVDDGRFL